jgi:hypothetical protein
MGIMARSARKVALAALITLALVHLLDMSDSMILARFFRIDENRQEGIER